MTQCRLIKDPCVVSATAMTGDNISYNQLIVAHYLCIDRHPTFSVAKKVVNEFRASEAKTGGGKTEVEEPTQLYWDLYNLLRSQFDRIICNVDSDAVASKRSMASDEKSSASVSPHDNSSMSQQSPSDNFNTQEIVTTKPPLQPAAKKICVLPEGVRTDREEETKTRLSLLEYQKDCLRREHEARMDTIKIEKAAAFAKLEYYQAKKASLMQYDTRYSTVNLNSTVNGQNSSFLLLDQQPFCPGPI
uniref:No apical meristem-associated C-terminal domain-containing protein n=1 Tax=Romanomermis culicivorax TaxID=13658 RepID=A0A915HHK1_ROMCU